MNIFETIYECNINHPSKLALSVTMDDGSTRAYTYGDVFRRLRNTPTGSCHRELERATALR